MTLKEGCLLFNSPVFNTKRVKQRLSLTVEKYEVKHSYHKFKFCAISEYVWQLKAAEKILQFCDGAENILDF